MFKKMTFLALLASSSVMADEQPTSNNFFYVGGMLGQISYDIKEDFDLDEVSAIDDKDIGFRVVGGYQFNRYFALETALVDLGEVSMSVIYQYSDDVINVHSATSATASTAGLMFQAVGQIPVTDNLKVYAKAGALAWSTEAEGHSTYRYTDTFGYTDYQEDSDSLSTDGTDRVLTFGVGYLYKSVEFRAEYEIIGVEDQDIKALNIGAVYRF